VSPLPRPDADDERQAFVGGLLGELQRQAALACRGRAFPHLLDPNSVCQAALTRVLEKMYGAFDRERHGCTDFCRRIFAVAVRDELVERARKRTALKNGGGYRELPFDVVAEALEARHGPLTDLTDAIEHLRRASPVRADVVTMRVFGNFTFGEIAEELRLDESTVRRQFKLAQAQLWRLFGAGVAP
jgi:DNA-directed RNA polymerase specialized sigma24 family protein